MAAQVHYAFRVHVAKLAIPQARRVRHAAENFGAFYNGTRSFGTDGHSGGDAETEPHKEVTFRAEDVMP